MARSEKEKQLLLQVGDAIRRCRRKQGLSQEVFARRAGIGRSYLASIERGEKNVAVLNFMKIAKGLGVEAADLLEWQEES